VRRPRLDNESHATGLDRNELGALLVAAGLGPPEEHALISLLALDGLRVSEATGADIEALGIERGHRTLVITRKGRKIVTIPLAPRSARAIDLAIGERAEGPIFLGTGGWRLDRHGAARIVRRTARRAGITKTIGPHTLRHAFITAALDAGVPLRDVQEAASHADPRTTMSYDRAAPPWTGTPPTSSPPTSPEQPGNHQVPGMIRLAYPRPGGSPAVTSPAAREPPFGTPGVLDRRVGESVSKDRSALTRSPDRVVACRMSYRRLTAPGAASQRWLHRWKGLKRRAGPPASCALRSALGSPPRERRIRPRRARTWGGLKGVRGWRLAGLWFRARDLCCCPPRPFTRCARMTPPQAGS
jgi:hypothetical protein